MQSVWARAHQPLAPPHARPHSCSLAGSSRCTLAAQIGAQNATHHPQQRRPAPPLVGAQANSVAIPVDYSQVRTISASRSIL